MLRPAQLSEAAAEMGYKLPVATLATKRSRGGSPPFRKFGPKAVVYRWGDFLDWLGEQVSEPFNSTSQQRQKPPPATSIPAIYTHAAGDGVPTHRLGPVSDPDWQGEPQGGPSSAPRGPNLKEAISRRSNYKKITRNVTDSLRVKFLIGKHTI